MPHAPATRPPITTTEMWLAAPMTSSRTPRASATAPTARTRLRPRRRGARSRHRGSRRGRDRGMRGVPAGHGRGRRGALITGTAIAGAGRTLGLAGRRPRPPDRLAGRHHRLAQLRHGSGTGHAERCGQRGRGGQRGPRRTRGGCRGGCGCWSCRWPRGRGAWRRGRLRPGPGRRRRGGNPGRESGAGIPWAGVPAPGAGRCCHQGWPAGTGGRAGAAAGCSRVASRLRLDTQSGLQHSCSFLASSSTCGSRSAASCFQVSVVNGGKKSVLANSRFLELYRASQSPGSLASATSDK